MVLKNRIRPKSRIGFAAFENMGDNISWAWVLDKKKIDPKRKRSVGSYELNLH